MSMNRTLLPHARSRTPAWYACLNGQALSPFKVGKVYLPRERTRVQMDVEIGTGGNRRHKGNSTESTWETAQLTLARLNTRRKHSPSAWMNVRCR